MSRRARLAILGLGVAVAYLGAASWTFSVGTLPVRPFFEGTGPPPDYRWVTPPAEFADGNVVPEPYEEVIPFVVRDDPKLGRVRIFEGGSITTPEAQVSVSVPSLVFAERASATGVRIRIEPVDPATLGPPPAERAFDGNGIRITTTYEPDGEAAIPVEQDCSLGGCINLIVRFPAFGSELWRLGSGETMWEPLEVQQVPSAFQLYGSIAQVGTFVVTGGRGTAHASSNGVRTVLAAVLGGLAVVGAVLAQRLAARRRRIADAPAGRRSRKGRAGAPKGRPSGSSGKPRDARTTKRRP